MTDIALNTTKNSNNEFPTTPSTPKSDKKLLCVNKSPCKISRIEEKTQLQECNNRLERYIFRQRAREQSIDLLKKQLEKAQNQISENKKRFQFDSISKFDRVRKECDELNSVVITLKSDREELMTRLRGHEIKIKNEEKKMILLQEKCDQLKKKHDIDSMMILKLRNLIDSHKSSEEQIKCENDILKEEVKNVRQERDSLAKKFNSFKNSKNRTDEDYEFLESEYKKQICAKNNELEELKAKLNDIKIDLRKEYTNKLNDNLKKKQEQSDAEKEKCIKELISTYDEKLSQLREELSEINEELDKYKNDAFFYENKYNEAMIDRESILKERDCLSKQVETLEKQISILKSKPLRRQKQDATIIKRLKEAYFLKEAEFECLLDTKIAMNLEIQAYRQMLDQEESRLNIDENKENEKSEENECKMTALNNEEMKPKRRKTRLSTRTEANKLKFDITSIDICVNSNFIEIFNKSDKMIHLNGLFLDFKKIKQKLGLNFKLESKCSLFVFPSKTISEKEKRKGKKVIWCENAFTESGNIFLIDNDGNELSHFNIQKNEKVETLNTK